VKAVAAVNVRKDSRELKVKSRKLRLPPAFDWTFNFRLSFVFNNIVASVPQKQSTGREKKVGSQDRFNLRVLPFDFRLFSDGFLAL